MRSPVRQRVIGEDHRDPDRRVAEQQVNRRGDRAMQFEGNVADEPGGDRGE